MHRSRIIYIYICMSTRKSKDQTLHMGSRESFRWIIPKTILCLVLDSGGMCLMIVFPSPPNLLTGSSTLPWVVAVVVVVVEGVLLLLPLPPPLLVPLPTPLPPLLLVLSSTLWGVDMMRHATPFTHSHVFEWYYLSVRSPQVRFQNPLLGGSSPVLVSGY